MEKVETPLSRLRKAEAEIAQRAIDILRQYMDGAISFQEALNALARDCGLFAGL